MTQRWVPMLFTLLPLVSGSSLNALKVRWGNLNNGYYDMPWTIHEAGLGTLWRKATFDEGLNVYMVSHLEDPRFFLLFDEQMTIAGVSFGFDKKDVNRVKLQDADHNYTFPDAMFHSARIWGKDLWLTPVLFADPEIIRNGGRPPLNSTKDGVVSALYYWADSQWHTVPSSQCDITTDLTEQGCYDGMGKHYFYRTDKSRPSCAEWQGFFATYNRGRLSGFGVAVFGSFLSTYYTTTYYEYPTFPVVRDILPERPACVDEWLPYTGVTMVHVFLTANAASFTCDHEPKCPQPQPQPSADTRSWFHRFLSSRANPHSQPSYSISVTLSTVGLMYYFFCF